MNLSGLVVGQQLIVQVIWGERKIEFYSYVVAPTPNGLYITPYMHNNSPLDLKIDTSGKVQCNVFAASPEDGHRISWKSVELHTVKRQGSVVYQIAATGYNYVAAQAERRKHERIDVNKPGKVYLPNQGFYTINVKDLSDIGIAIVSKELSDPVLDKITVLFNDSVGDKYFNMSVECRVVRVQKLENGTLWGCIISGENRDFLLYCFLLRMMNKSKNEI